MKTIVLLIGIGLLIVNCGNYTNIRRSFTPDDIPKNTQLDFATIKKEILDSQCINCHKNKHKDYEDYEVVKASAFAMLERIETTVPMDLMPEGGPPLNNKLKAMFKEWVQAGAPQFKGDTPPTKPTEKIGFSEVKEKLLKPYNCIACHSQYNDYLSVYKSRNSIMALVSSNEMPFPKKKGMKTQPVDDKNKKLLFNWIEQGAPLKAGDDNTPQTEVELKPTWISLRNHVFGPKCILCHNTFGNRGGGKSQSFESYPKLRNWFTKDPDLFKFDKKQEDPPGLFVESMERPACDPDELFCFPSPMPFNTSEDDIQGHIAPITTKEMAIIKEWIRLKLPYSEDEL